MLFRLVLFVFFSLAMIASIGLVILPMLTTERWYWEMKRFKEMGVYAHVRREEAMAEPEINITGVRWVNVNKGTALHPS